MLFAAAHRTVVSNQMKPRLRRLHQYPGQEVQRVEAPLPADETAAAFATAGSSRTRVPTRSSSRSPVASPPFFPMGTTYTHPHLVVGQLRLEIAASRRSMRFLKSGSSRSRRRPRFHTPPRLDQEDGETTRRQVSDRQESAAGDHRRARQSFALDPTNEEICKRIETIRTAIRQTAEQRRARLIE